MTPKKARFIDEVLIDGNATRAAKAAGCAARSAHVTGARWLKDPVVAAAIADREARLAARAELTATLVRAKVAAVLRADPKNLYDRDGYRIPVHLLDDDNRAAIAGVEDEVTEGPAFVTTRTQRLKLLDGLRAAELGAKLLKLLGDGDAFSATVVPGTGGLAPDSEITVRLVRAG